MIQSVDSFFHDQDFGTEISVSTARSSRRCPSNRGGGHRSKEKNNSPGVSMKEKKRQGSLTTKWLKQNYCACPDVCLPREIVYEQYLEFCRKEKVSPTCKATFGKLIRNAFPEVSSKRLGARGHSKYHYNGIGMKHSDEYRNSVPSFEGITRFSTSSSNSEQHIIEGWRTFMEILRNIAMHLFELQVRLAQTLKKFSLSSKVGTLLPNFPDVEDLIIPVITCKAKLKTFLLMYKTHCQCIVDMAIGGNFEEIRLFLLHFWQGFPEHLISLTKLDIFFDLVAVCDCILHRTLLDILIPPTTFEMPERLLRDIHNTGMHWGLWMQSSLENMPQQLVKVKMTLARRFCRYLKRCVAFMYLAQVCRPILASDSPILVCKELEELQPVILNYARISNAECEDTANGVHDIAKEQEKDLQNILGNCRSVEILTESLDKMINSLKSWKEQDKEETRNFLFHWMYMLSKISYVLTEKQSSHFTSFHLLSSLIQEYMLLAAESQLDKEQEELIYLRLKMHFNSIGNTISNAFKPPTSSFLVKHKTPTDSKRNIKYKKRQKKECKSSETPTADYSNNEVLPKTYAQWFRTESEKSYNCYEQVLPVQDMSSCKYASKPQYSSNMHDCDQNPNTGSIHDHCINETYPHHSESHPPGQLYGRLDRMHSLQEGTNLSPSEFCQFDAGYSIYREVHANQEPTRNDYCQHSSVHSMLCHY